MDLVYNDVSGDIERTFDGILFPHLRRVNLFGQSGSINLEDVRNHLYLRLGIINLLFSHQFQIRLMLQSAPVLEHLNLANNVFITGGLTYQETFSFRSDSLVSLDLSQSNLNNLGNILPGSFSRLETINLYMTDISLFTEGSLEFLTGPFFIFSSQFFMHCLTIFIIYQRFLLIMTTETMVWVSTWENLSPLRYCLLEMFLGTWAARVKQTKHTFPDLIWATTLNLNRKFVLYCKTLVKLLKKCCVHKDKRFFKTFLALQPSQITILGVLGLFSWCQ